jgi:hypothetical protein
MGSAEVAPSYPALSNLLLTRSLHFRPYVAV